jgi:mannose/fructose/N-acetylgalactosamine-specific phosphotransferase system component IIB
MKIVLARIDNRLIHGQVLEAWVPSTRADCIVVANDQVAGLSLQSRLMAAAVPKNIKVFIGSLEDVNISLLSDEFIGNRILLLFENSRDALRGHQLGMQFDSLNLGNMHAGDGKIRFSCTLALDNADIDNLSQLEEEGVSIACQCIPADRIRPWRKLIKEIC